MTAPTAEERAAALVRVTDHSGDVAGRCVCGYVVNPAVADDARRALASAIRDAEGAARAAAIEEAAGVVEATEIVFYEDGEPSAKLTRSAAAGRVRALAARRAPAAAPAAGPEPEAASVACVHSLVGVAAGPDAASDVMRCMDCGQRLETVLQRVARLTKERDEAIRCLQLVRQCAGKVLTEGGAT